MKKIVSIVVFLLVACMIAPSAFAALPEHDGSYIYDETGVLDDQDKEAIKKENDELFVGKGARVGVCIVDNTGDKGAKDVAKELYEKWGLNGVLILYVKSAPICVAVPGQNLQDILPEEKLNSLVNISTKDDELSASMIASVKAVSSFIKQNYDEQATKGGKSGFGKVVGVILRIVLVVAIILAAGYVVLIVLERRQARQRREYLEERRRRMAQSGRGSYYAPRNEMQRRSGEPRPSGTRRPPQDEYAPQNDYERQIAYQRQQNAIQTRQRTQGRPAASDRFVYPDARGTGRTSVGNRPVPNARSTQNLRRPSPRGAASDFDREYFSRPDANDNNATREFKTDNN